MTPRQLGDLIDRLGPALVLYARQWTAAPEDVVQDAFLRLVEARRPPDDPAAWLFAVVRNRALDLAKADRRRAKREQAPRPARPGDRFPAPVHPERPRPGPGRDPVRRRPPGRPRVVGVEGAGRYARRFAISDACRPVAEGAGFNGPDDPAPGRGPGSRAGG